MGEHLSPTSAARGPPTRLGQTHNTMSNQRECGRNDFLEWRRELRTIGSWIVTQGTASDHGSAQTRSSGTLEDPGAFRAARVAQSSVAAQDADAMRRRPWSCSVKPMAALTSAVGCRR